MKTILITYEAASWDNEAKEWENGEAAAKLEFLPDDTVKALVDSIGMKRSQMDHLTLFKCEQIEKILEGLEYLRHRAYVADSIKSITEEDINNA